MPPRRPAAALAAAGSAVLAAHVRSAVRPISDSAGHGRRRRADQLLRCNTGCVYSPGTVDPGDSSVSGFALDSVRLYINGGVTDQIKLTFNTEYTGSGPGENKVEVMDAIGRFEFSDQFNIWAGRFLPPSDRANLYGPYYANDWAPYADGVADYYPNVAVGRDNGVAYWGDFGMVKVQVGAVRRRVARQQHRGDGPEQDAVCRPRDVGFLGQGEGLLLQRHLLRRQGHPGAGVAAQTQDSKTTFSLDGLMEKKLAGLGAVGVEAEYSKDNGLNRSTRPRATAGMCWRATCSRR